MVSDGGRKSKWNNRASTRFSVPWCWRLCWYGICYTFRVHAVYHNVAFSKTARAGYSVVERKKIPPSVHCKSLFKNCIAPRSSNNILVTHSCPGVAFCGNYCSFFSVSYVSVDTLYQSTIDWTRMAKKSRIQMKSLTRVKRFSGAPKKGVWMPDSDHPGEKTHPDRLSGVIVVLFRAVSYDSEKHHHNTSIILMDVVWRHLSAQ